MDGFSRSETRNRFPFRLPDLGTLLDLNPEMDGWVSVQIILV